MTHRLAGALVTSLVALLPAGAGATVLAPDAAGAPRCLGRVATVVGTPGSDDLRGTHGPDVVVGLGGDDTIETGRGRDLVCAGRGFDFVSTDQGRDRVRGGPGDDTVIGGRGNDLLRGLRGVDSLFGGSGDDVLRAGVGESFIVEGLVGGPGDDRLYGGPGRDSAQFFDSPVGVRVDLRSGRSTGRGRDLLFGIEGVVGSNRPDVIIGHEGGNGLFGQGGDDRITAGPSGTLRAGTLDVLSGDGGDDDLRGGGGEDLVTYARTPVAVSVDLGRGSASGQGDDTLSGVEAVQGSRLNDVLVGGPTGDLLVGGPGDDNLDGAEGSDTALWSDVVGPVEADLRTGAATGPAAGSDMLKNVENLRGTSTGDVLHGDEGTNRLEGAAGDDVLAGYGAVDLLDGGAGSDECRDAPAELVDCEVAGDTRRTAALLDGWLAWVRSPEAGGLRR